jgi:hypothetical protein
MKSERAENLQSYQKRGTLGSDHIVYQPCGPIALVAQSLALPLKYHVDSLHGPATTKAE